MVATGILASRVLGLVRQRVFGHFLGTSDGADVFNAAFKIPNILQNLFGEGVLSASFIPVYARLLAEGRKDDARRLAGAIAGLLGLATGLVVLVGVLATPVLIDLIAPGFSGLKRDETIRLVRILFPGAGFLALSAWCLGILNSHRRFLLSYAAPVGWNVVMILALLWYGPGRDQFPLVEIVAWASVIGSALQFGLQLPVVLRLARPAAPHLDRRSEPVRNVLSNFIPVFIGRGVFQISGYIDTVLASLLPGGAVAGLAYAQTIAMLPVSLFGMSVAAAELPAMAGVAGAGTDAAAGLVTRLNAGLKQIAFFVVPSAAVFLALGDVLAGAVYQSGAFTAGVTIYVWGILAGSAVGLLASTLSRLYSSVYYALRDTRTPLRYAIIRVILTIGLGLVLAFVLPPLLGIEKRWGAAGLTTSAGIAAWIEFLLLRRSLNRRLGPSGVPPEFLLRLWAAAALGAGAGWGVKLLRPAHDPIAAALVILGAFGVVYLAATLLFRVPQASALVARLRRQGNA